MAKRTSMSLLDYMNMRVEAEQQGAITLEQFTEAMQSGDRARMDEAVDAMYEAGGYDNLA